MFLQIILFILSAILLTKYLRAKQSRSNGTHGATVGPPPPGPRFRLPVFGHLFFLGKYPQRTLMEWGKLYGPVISVQMGTYPAVIINDGQLIRKAFNSSCLAPRPKIKFYEDYSFGGQGIFMAEEHCYRERRQFFLKNVIKDFAAKGTSIEQRILHEVKALLAELNSMKDTPFTIHGFFNRNIINTLLRVVVSLHFEPEDPRFNDLQYGLEKVTSIEGARDILSIYVPKLPEWFPNLIGYTQRFQAMRDLIEFFRPIVDEHRNTAEKGRQRDLLDVYLETMAETSDPNSSFHPQKELNLLMSLSDLFLAGMETTSKQLEWILYYMSKYPEIQRKVQNEIDHVVGSTLDPSLDHRSVLVYTEAMIQEALRKASIVPLGIMHATREDYELNGYVIPQGTIVIGNLFASHYNPEVWGDPDEFRPERFIDSKGKLKKIEALIPFGIGKRNCLGEVLARHQLFMYTVGILQKFSVSAAGQLPSEDGFGVTVSPQPFDIIFQHRA